MSKINTSHHRLDPANLSIPHNSTCFTYGSTLMKYLPGRNYLAYILRLWQEGEATSWRATLENPQNGKRYAFSDLEKLYAFLEDRTSVKENKENENEE
jgi:hypothetical protein